MQLCHSLHFRIGQLKVKDTDVFKDMVGILRTRNRDIACLQMSAEYYLCRCLTVRFSNIHDRIITKQVLRMTSAAERIPRFYHRTVFCNIFLKLRVLIKRVIFILYHRRLELAARSDTFIFCEGIIVRNADRPQLSVLDTLTKSLVDLSIIAARLMYQHQVNVVKSEPFK